MDIVFHYPPELMNLLIDTIPRLCRSYEDTLQFFQGAGVEFAVTADLWVLLKKDKGSLNKFKIVREVLTKLNEQGEATLRERREILKRVTEFEDFATCWPDDRLEAQGLVSRIQRVVNVKDSFTRMKEERAQERQQHISKREAEANTARKQKEAIAQLKDELFALFRVADASKRGKALEGILNRLFKAYGILGTRRVRPHRGRWGRCRRASRRRSRARQPFVFCRNEVVEGGNWRSGNIAAFGPHLSPARKPSGHPIRL